jgi:CheY-like chemotaxis protein
LRILRAKTETPMTETTCAATKTILLVEDDDVVRQLTAEVLGEFGYHVHALRDGPSALELLRSEQHFDLLMSDIGLPGMDGRELVAAARLLRPTLPVLFASGYNERELLEEVRARDSAAATNSIVKPYDFKLLGQRLSELAG